jgi:AAA family ATP:ADP antiporter
MSRWIEAVKIEILSHSLTTRLFILSAMLSGFLISFDYAVIRPVSNSVFITAYGSSLLPYAWLATVPLNLIGVALYNKYLPRLGCFKMFTAIVALVMTMNLFAALFMKQFSFLPFLFYIWKEMYIMMMFQQLWSVIHSVISFKKAKYLYGMFFGCGALGAVAGSMIPGFLAHSLGSETLLFSTIPTYLLLLFTYRSALSHTQEGIGFNITDEKKHTSLSALLHGAKMISSSHLLTFILSIVVLMQLSSSLIDYQFNTVLEKTIALKDLRTEYTARILSIVHASSICLQLFGSFLLIHCLGVRRSHLLIPLLLCLNSFLFLLFPLFGVISFSYIAIKCFDFSLFGVIKEMLYIPLKPDEKFRAKSLIDVFALRSSKAFASVIILLLQPFLAVTAFPLLTWSGMLVFVLWIAIVIRMLKSTELQENKFVEN